MSLHDIPDAAGLVEAVREFLEKDVMGATDGRVRFHTRVAINALKMVERQMRVGPAQEAAHRDRLHQLGVSDDRELSAAIRRGDFDDNIHAVADAVGQAVRDKLLVANPNYLT